MKMDRWSAAFDKMYPELREIQKSSKDRDECMKKYVRNEQQMLSAQEQIGLEWEKIGTAFLNELVDHFETEWPEDKKEVVGYISALPAYPRFLDDYSFCIGYKDVPNMIETSAHEILHFIWFKKWKEVFPEIERRQYESPHLVWRLSEIMDPIILQCNPKIKELIKPQKWGYKSFESIKIGDVSMIEYFKDIYLRSVGSGDSFEVTLKKLWEEAKKHEEEISKF